MPMWEVRNVLYCHLMDLETQSHGNWGIDICTVKEALKEVIDGLDREMGYLKKTGE